MVAMVLLGVASWWLVVAMVLLGCCQVVTMV